MGKWAAVWIFLESHFHETNIICIDFFLVRVTAVLSWHAIEMPSVGSMLTPLWYQGSPIQWNQSPDPITQWPHWTQCPQSLLSMSMPFLWRLLSGNSIIIAVHISIIFGHFVSCIENKSVSNKFRKQMWVWTNKRPWDGECPLALQINAVPLNSVWSSHAIWSQIWVRLSIKTPSHHLNQCWHLIGEILWHSPESTLTVSS